MSLNVLPIQKKTNSLVGSSSTALTAVFANNTVAGNLIVVAISWEGASTVVNLTDSQGNAYTLVGSILTSTGNDHVALYYCANTVGGANTVTFQINAGGTAAYKAMAIAEFPGTASTTLDTSTTGTGSSTSIASGTLTPAASGELLIGFATISAGPQFSTFSDTWNSIFQWENFSNSQPLFLAFQIAGSTAAIGYTVTSNQTGAWAAGIAAFKNMGSNSGGGSTNSSFAISG